MNLQINFDQTASIQQASYTNWSNFMQKKNNNLKTIPSKSNGYSRMPVVGTRARRMSCSVGKKSGFSIRGISSR